MGNHWERAVVGEAHRESEGPLALILDRDGVTLLFSAVVVLLSLSYYSNTCSVIIKNSDI